ncbi:plasmid partitioning protein RepB C-terminal domain-containing protein [Roseateles chitinivorans]|uniref:plasmid partitioning protein RepB C-terminal domain-containing protein n=1 Tax=Roseateles chitinivorans TaxID=2917965 RepID=UPI003D671575
MTGVSLAFVPDPVSVELTRLLPSRRVPDGLTATRKFRQIRSSIEEIGLIEPLSVTRAEPSSGQHVILDGHVRLVVLRDIGWLEAPCLASTDDEGYTYNNRVNRLSSVQEHLMIRRAIDRGVSPERIAKALSVDVSHILKKNSLLDGLCSEVIDLLRDKNFSVELARVLRKMKPPRQIECAELMVSANKLSVSYGEALLVASPPSSLIDGPHVRNMRGVTPEQMSRMEREMANLQGQYRLVEQSYGQDVLNLVLTRGYLKKLLANEKIARYLRLHQPEMTDQFTSIVETESLD